jgi:hypothetical protein
MSPVIHGANLKEVSTERKPRAEGEYLVTIMKSEMNGKMLVIKTKIEEAPEDKDIGQEFWDWVNIVQNDGKLNQISMEHLKRYMEAVFGKGSPEADAEPPDTDVLDGHQVRLYLIVDSYEDKKDIDPETGKGRTKTNNKVKSILPA